MTNEKISIKGMNKANVFVGLFRAAKLQEGIEVLEFNPILMDKERAEKILKNRTRFEYFEGRALKIDLSGDEFDPRFYNHENGPGIAEQVIDALRKSKKKNRF